MRKQLYNAIVRGNHPIHWCDCSLYNEPAFPNKPCDCGAAITHKKWYSYVYHLFCIRLSVWGTSHQAVANLISWLIQKDANAHCCYERQDHESDIRQLHDDPQLLCHNNEAQQPSNNHHT